LQIETGQLMKGLHDLRKLFLKLPQRVQDSIEQRFNANVIPREYDLSKATDDAKKVTEARPKNFREALKVGASAFVEYRYLYESAGNANFYGLFELPPILRT